MSVRIVVEKSSIRSTMKAVRKQFYRDIRTAFRVGWRFAKSIAPVLTGRFRNSIRLVKNTILGSELFYAIYLEDGSSSQARNGVFGPTKKKIEKTFRQLQKRVRKF